MAAATATPGKYLNLDETPVQGQTGWALLDFSGTALVLSGSISKEKIAILYQMLLETTQITKEEEFRKMTISFPSSQYLVSRDENHIYVVETAISIAK